MKQWRLLVLVLIRYNSTKYLKILPILLRKITFYVIVLSKGGNMEKGFELELHMLDEKRKICIITINDLNATLYENINSYICKIWQGNTDEDINFIKKQILEFIYVDGNIKIGAIAEFFIHLYLNIDGYKPLCLFQNLEENSFKKGFDGYFTINEEEWIVESKSTEDTKIKHHSKISEAYNDLDDKVKGNTSNNPWKNAYNHASNLNVLAPEKVRKQLYDLAKEFTNGRFHNLSEYNIMPCSTKFINNEELEKSDFVYNTVLNKINQFEFNKIIAICINNKAADLFIDYLRS